MFNSAATKPAVRRWHFIGHEIDFVADEKHVIS
jgi:hypothetical protein